jgi:DNA helicase-2/ATP-dependent DNA helicase PcrA
MQTEPLTQQMARSALRLPAALAREIADLHPQQREAARHHGNLVLVAGPGAGKTRTLVARVGHLLASISTHRGVGAITFTDAAASEVTARLGALGMRPGRRLASRTVHSFCLHHILRPYARFTDVPFRDDLTILDDKQSNELWGQAAIAAGLPVKNRPDPLLIKIRRLLAAGEDLQDYQRQYIRAVQLYEEALIDIGGLDFDAMPARALSVLRGSQPTRAMLAARFPYLVVDEYQDLGPVLHAVVTELLAAGVQVTAVGDPDQTMYAFQGADRRYLKELHERDDFTTIQLTVNFRSGSTLVAAGRGVLGVDRGYQAAPEQETPGTVTVKDVVGDLDDHARRAVDVARHRIAAGVPAEDIAILYPRNELLPYLTAALEDADLPCDMERTRKIPGGSLADFVSACAARRLAGPVPGLADHGRPASNGAADEDPGQRHLPRFGVQRSAGIPSQTVPELVAAWHHKRVAAGVTVAEKTPRSLARQLLELVDAPDRDAPEDDASAFLEQLLDRLDIDRLANLSSDLRDQQTRQAFRAAAERGLTMAELAGGRAPGRIVLTTYHSAKGREFSVVILPGLVDGLMPFYFANRRLTGQDLREQRHNFYVAFTRAEHEVVLITGDHFTDPYYGPRITRRSRFADDILGQMND